MLSGHYNGVLFSPLGLELAQFPVKAQHISVRLSIFLSLLQRVEVGSGQELFYTAVSTGCKRSVCKNSQINLFWANFDLISLFHHSAPRSTPVAWNPAYASVLGHKPAREEEGVGMTPLPFGHTFCTFTYIPDAGDFKCVMEEKFELEEILFAWGRKGERVTRWETPSQWASMQESLTTLDLP